MREALDGQTGAAVLVYVPHTTAGVTINEHADPLVAARLRDGARAHRPGGVGLAAHRGGRGERALAPARLVMGPQVLVPFRDGELALGTWQGIFFCEFDGPRTRSVYVSVLQ